MSFSYSAIVGARQILLPSVARSESFDTPIFIRQPELTVISFVFDDVPDPANRVTPRFALPGGEVFLEGVSVDEPNVTQIYAIGHGQSLPIGIVGKITGMLEGVGEGQDQMVDLDITLDDPWEKEGITGHYPFIPAEFVMQMIHDGTVPITYSAAIVAAHRGR